jgi:hypothetical protein
MGESEDDSCDGVTLPRNGKVENYLVTVKPAFGQGTRSCLASMPINTGHLTKTDSAFLNRYYECTGV